MRTRRLRRPFAVLALALALAGTPAVTSAAAAGGQTRAGIPPAPGRWATDQAGFLSPQTVEALDSRLEDYERRTGHQLLVWIGRTIGDNEVLEDWAVRTFEAWQVGRKGLDDGLVLFILAEDRKVRIEVGYGLEDKVPDAYAYRVIANILAPGIRAGRPDEAVEAAVTALIGYIGGDANAAGGEPRARAGSKAKSIFGLIIFVILAFLFITNPSLAIWLLMSFLGGGGGGRGGGGGGWGGGGGFSGGGGRSGGGGASGGW
ncbi:MAG TPA: TPM domain-containing protein [Candidatus Aminicenantes bacterium]|nr:TPM domain-containing protein [Candidatus Aminicenantes bacterium]HRY64422.1 TPM domain-containing protein [Candidatus Aminicenantes bacterium]HRZ71335.1 TPM domain-containing protein [Candidatus Aminicenantes bacterium]